MNKKHQTKGLPEKVIFCKKCVISNQRPSSSIEFKNHQGEKKKVIHFDENGVCAACRYHEEKEKNIDWEKRENSLIKLLNNFKQTIVVDILNIYCKLGSNQNKKLAKQSKHVFYIYFMFHYM